jgi:molybdate/tungstate transport system permease protein
MSSSNALAEGSSRRFRGLLVPAALGGLLVVYFAVALVAFLARTGTRELLAGLSTPGARSAIRNSLLTAPVSTAIATVLGVPLAYVLARRSFPGKRVLEALVLLPLVVPPVVGGAMVLTAVGRFMPIGAAAAAVGIPLTGSLVGVVLAQTFVAAPFRNVSLPLARGAIVAGVVLTFARAIGEFGATMMVAYNPRTMPTRIWVEFIAGGIDATVPLALALLSIAVVVLVALTRLAGVPTVIER